MKNVLIAGGSGLVGRRLCTLLMEKGYQVGILSRSERQDKHGIRYFQWNPGLGTVEETAISWAQVIINLAGEGIADQRWTTARKKVITQSRVDANMTLLGACQSAGQWPEVYLSAGGMNYYGDSGSNWLTEESPIGTSGYLPQSCAAWENAVSLWSSHVRTVQFRISIVLSTKGGALPKMTITLPIGIVPYFGNGRQYYSWIHIDDLSQLFIHAMENDSMRGVYNAGSPSPVTARQFAKDAIASRYSWGLTPSVPTFLVNLILGEMSETVMSSVRLSVDKVLKSGFDFQYGELKEALIELRSTKK
jgi:uncharacterized protein (TIGR01777 family)